MKFVKTFFKVILSLSVSLEIWLKVGCIWILNKLLIYPSLFRAMSPSIDYAVTLGLAFCLAIKYVFWDDDNIEKDIEIIEEHPVTKSEDAITPIKRKLLMSTAMQNIVYMRQKHSERFLVYNGDPI